MKGKYCGIFGLNIFLNMPLNLTKINCINIKNLLKSRIYEQITKYLTADDSVVHNNNANDMRVTQDFNSFGEIV
jgi:hypothetical protein